MWSSIFELVLLFAQVGFAIPQGIEIQSLTSTYFLITATFVGSSAVSAPSSGTGSVVSQGSRAQSTYITSDTLSTTYARSTSVQATNSVRPVSVTEAVGQSSPSTPSSTSSAQGLSPGIRIGIRIGTTITIGVLIFATLVAFLVFRKKHNTRCAKHTVAKENTTNSSTAQRVELDNGYIFPPEAFVWEQAKEKPELMTTANTHELEGVAVLAVPSGSGSTIRRHELPGRDLI